MENKLDLQTQKSQMELSHLQAARAETVDFMVKTEERLHKLESSKEWFRRTQAYIVSITIITTAILAIIKLLGVSNG